MTKKVKQYIVSETASSEAITTVLIIVGLIGVAVFVIYRIYSSLQKQADASQGGVFGVE